MVGLIHKIENLHGAGEKLLERRRCAPARTTTSVYALRCRGRKYVQTLGRSHVRRKSSSEHLSKSQHYDSKKIQLWKILHRPIGLFVQCMVPKRNDDVSFRAVMILVPVLVADILLKDEKYVRVYHSREMWSGLKNEEHDAYIRPCLH